MSNASNDNGRAYEYICLVTLNEEINKYRSALIIENSSFQAAYEAWCRIEYCIQNNLIKSANAAVEGIFDLEPLIFEEGDDIVELMIQSDRRGEEGDVRDIVISRENIRWEIGLSVKHNHFAVKHSRLSKKLDFGYKWFGISCSSQYWEDVAPVFEYLEFEKQKGTKWRELTFKDEDVYIPILKAFLNEILRTYQDYPELPAKMVEYLLGEYDFYKVISLDNSKKTQIQTFNLRGTLNQSTRRNEPKLIVPIANLPTRIVHFDFKPESSNTLELYMDEGWQFSFRIHNAATNVEPSLKFDIQIVGSPTTIVSIDCFWN